MTATTKSSSLESCIQACLQCLKDYANCATACLENDIMQMMTSSYVLSNEVLADTPQERLSITTNID